jgi:tRNA(fMet)-specific endonuclease VapC
MNGRYLLDTSVLIALLADERVVKEKLAQADEVFVPSVAIGELYYGAWKSQRVHENLARIDELVSESAVLGCGVEAARRYGEVKNAVRLKGRPIPENDLWIAAIAVEHGLTLTTRDAHFSEVAPLLKVEMW